MSEYDFLVPGGFSGLVQFSRSHCFQITAGSMWKQEEEKEGTAPVQKYLVKWDGKSYLHVSWEVSTDLVELTSRTNTQVGL